MKCVNCSNLVPDDVKSCPFCGVYLTQAVLPDTFSGYNLDIAGIRFKLDFRGDGRIYVGRKDIERSPDIDLGPFDGALAVSRMQGFFIEKNGNLYYIDLSRNGTCINGVRVKKNEAVIVRTADKMSFSGVNGEIVKT